MASAPPNPPYAPASPTIRQRMPTIVPSRVQAELDVLHLAAAVRHRDAGSRSGSRPTSPAGCSRRRGRDRDACSAASPGLPPNAPPTCGRDHAESCGSRSNIGADRRRPKPCGICVDDVHGEVVAGAVVAGDDRDRVALHRHRPRCAGSRCGPARHVGAVEHVGLPRAADRGREVRAELLELHRARRARARPPGRRRRAAGRTRRRRARRRRPPRPASRPRRPRPRRRRTAPCRAASGGRGAAGVELHQPVVRRRARGRRR